MTSLQTIFNLWTRFSFKSKALHRALCRLTHFEEEQLRKETAAKTSFYSFLVQFPIFTTMTTRSSSRDHPPQLPPRDTAIYGSMPQVN